MLSWEYSKFYSRTIDKFSGPSSIDARLAVGRAFSKSPGKSASVLKEALQYSNKYNRIGENYSDSTSGNIKSGKGDAEYFVAIYFWLHREKKHSKLTDKIDLEVFGGIIDYKDHFGIKPSAPFEWPDYVTQEKADQAAKEIASGGDTSVWLNPFNHRSIPLEGRDDEWKKLDKLIKDDAPFCVVYIIAPSGAGKTRLISQWIRRFVADPDNTECPEEKVAGWDAGFVVSREKEPWKDWQPECDTHIIIDYTYNYDEVIGAIYEKARQNHGYKIRLLILEHILPNRPDSDVAHRKTSIDPRLRGTAKDDLEPEVETISLSPNEHSLGLLGNVIAHAARLFAPEENFSADDPRIEAATTALLAMGENPDDAGIEKDAHRVDAVRHPLFAALMGQTLALNPNDDPTKLKRRDLIEQYFKPAKRIPWRESEQNAHYDSIGSWIGAYVSAATLLRGVGLDHLKKFLPRKFNETQDRTTAIKYIEQISCRLVSHADEKERILKPLEPDILGENFFLIFLERFIDGEELFCLRQMLSIFETPEHENEAVSNFLETIRRLVRNLINDDQETQFSKDAWRNLSSFLSPGKFVENSLMQKAVSIALGDAIRQLRQAGLDDVYIKRFSDKLSINDLVELSETWLSMETAFATVHYFERLLGRSKTEDSYQAKVQTILTAFNQYHNEPAFAQILIGQEGCLCVLEHIFVWNLIPKINQGTTDNGWTALMAACAAGHLDVATLLLDRDAKINQGTTDNGWTALMAACAAGHLDVATLLLDRDAKIDQGKTDNGWTALMAACAAGHLDVATLLLDRDAKIDQGKTDNGWTALMAACQEGHLDVATLLLDRDAKIDQGTTDNGWTALMAACAAGHLDVATLLLDRDAKINQGTTDNGATALMAACAAGHLDVATLLLDRDAKINQGTTDNGATALMAACAAGHLDVATLLLDRDAKIDQGKTDNGWTALMAACAAGHLDVATLLLDRDAKINQGTTDNGWTALIVASNANRMKVVGILLNSPHVDPNIQENANQFSALIFAAGYGYLEILSLLIEHKDIDLDICAENHSTALHYAAALNKPDSVKMLLGAGANPTIKSVEGTTASHYALKEGKNQELHDLLKQAEADWLAKHGTL